MSNERVRWLLVTPEDVPSPPGAFVGVVMSDGDFRLHLCYERAQARKILDAAPGTSAETRARFLQILSGSRLPERSDFSGFVIHGWVAVFIQSQFVDENGMLDKEDVEEFGELKNGYDLFLSGEGSGTLALLMEYEEAEFRFWVLPSRAAARYKLTAVRLREEEEVYQETLREIDESQLPEEDGEREMICIDGGLGWMLALAVYCNMRRIARENEFST
jgi:hypothetical protein